MDFEEFASARSPALLRYATLLSGDREEARDIVQEVLARAMLRWRRITANGEPYGYVRRMVTNEFLSLLRRRRRISFVPLTQRDLDGPHAPAAPVVDADGELWQLLGTLPRQQRAVIVLRYYEGLTDAEIAEVLDCRPSTVRGYASRALTTLRIELTDPPAGVVPATLGGLL
ncbi:SigE family RNA polymerase sigma factor [Actinoplanes teichomyceticus]|uniref:RNA polymerase sigma-70 factor (Sigma-E family) n=1 Tax=Actinoplanes teichomyceticus TaxID=1867 RepID=A0A561WQ67_ACTTI|nr:SigE family RNA polymerase sigma factor [Actinoplanes teichomyceticus]TWG26016.1 RNA polymerase sigma-70 factor (sigma-E family) [Actinoplanes teichomyceticus]GIF11091.1 RNA polymerase [Actinoplanes teichomyceticus]